MSEPAQQECPLCQLSTAFYPEDHGNLKHFYCKNCNEFVISRSAERRLAESTNERRKYYALSASGAPEGQILHITLPSEDPKGGFVITGRYVPKKV